MPTPYSPGGGSVDALLGHLFAVQRVGQLDQDAGAVAHQLVGAHCAAMVQVLEDLQALLDDGVALLALDVGHEADAAGVVLVGAGIQTVFLEMLDLGSRRHGALLQFFAGKGSILHCTNNAKYFNWGQIPIKFRLISVGINWGHIKIDSSDSRCMGMRRFSAQVASGRRAARPRLAARAAVVRFLQRLQKVAVAQRPSHASVASVNAA